MTDAEVPQEILHRYVAINRRDAIQPAFDALIGVVDDIYPIEPADVERSRCCPAARLSTRDAVHVALMQRHEISRILSSDRGFDSVGWIERIAAI